MSLVKADQHAALLRDMTHGKPRAISVVPRRPADRRKQRFRFHAPDALERVLERFLLAGHLERGIGVLERAASTDAEMGTTGGDARRARLVDRDDARDIVGRRLLERVDSDLLAWERALDEHRFTLDAGDAPAFLIER